MICCDKCEEWFHGKCVGITRKMGSDMEKAQNEWLCPNCIKKQQPSIKVSVSFGLNQVQSPDIFRNLLQRSLFFDSIKVWKDLAATLGPIGYNPFVQNVKQNI